MTSPSPSASRSATASSSDDGDRCAARRANGLVSPVGPVGRQPGVRASFRAKNEGLTPVRFPAHDVSPEALPHQHSDRARGEDDGRASPEKVRVHDFLIPELGVMCQDVVTTRRPWQNVFAWSPHRGDHVPPFRVEVARRLETITGRATCNQHGFHDGQVRAADQDDQSRGVRNSFAFV